MTLSRRMSEGDWRGGTLERDVATTIVGLGAILGGLAVAVLAAQATYRVAGTEHLVAVVVGQPLVHLVLPGVLVVGWVGLGAFLLDGRGAAVPAAAGAYLGSAVSNAGAMETAWINLGPAPVIDPITYLLVVSAQAVVGQPTSEIAGVSFPVVGTISSLLIAFVLLWKTVQDPGITIDVPEAISFIEQ